MLLKSVSDCFILVSISNSYVDNLTEEQKGAFMEAFDLYDKNRDGRICSDELGQVMRLLGENPTENELVEFIASVR
jgi:Ca2+-binding EF-hand superfamily protein